MTARIIGRVQGVWFRKYTHEKGVELGLTGWVMNLDNGDVELVAEGNSDALFSLNKWLMTGSPLSHVEEIQVTWEKHQYEFESFEIRT